MWALKHSVGWLDPFCWLWEGNTLFLNSITLKKIDCVYRAAVSVDHNMSSETDDRNMHQSACRKTIKTQSVSLQLPFGSTSVHPDKAGVHCVSACTGSLNASPQEKENLSATLPAGLRKVETVATTKQNHTNTLKQMHTNKEQCNAREHALN